MKELTRDNDDSALDWLFTKARKYPLLTAESEQAIDLKKWQVLQRLQMSLVADQCCRNYLRAWAINTLHNPPTLEGCERREHYYLLRREQAEFLEGGEQREALIKFCKRISGTCSKKYDGKAITELHLPAVLVVGLAETLLNECTPRGVTAALRAWQESWTTLPQASEACTGPDTVRALRQGIAQYYEARDQLVNHNLRLVFSIAGRLTSRGVPYRDLIQCGILGLIRAAEKFEQRKGYRFSTYAFNWIHQAIRSSIEDQRGIVRYPSGVNEKMSQLHRERIHHLNTTGNAPDVQTLAQRLKMKPQAVRQLQQIGNLSISLDTPPSDDVEGPALRDTIAGGPFASTTGAAEQDSLNRYLMQNIKLLEPVEQQIVIQRWGLDRGAPRTRAEIAHGMGVSTEWIRQLELSALVKLRKNAGIVEAYRDHQGFES